MTEAAAVLTGVVLAVIVAPLLLLGLEKVADWTDERRAEATTLGVMGAITLWSAVWER